jgi:hypothetical protein
MGQPSNFIQESYDLNDAPAKKLVADYLERIGYENIQTEETFDHDIIAEREGVKFYFEVEMKSRYRFRQRETFPFDTVHFLGRKERLHRKQPFYYVIVGPLEEWAVICHSGDIYKDEQRKYVQVQTTSRYGWDNMFEVHRNKCLFVDLNSNQI